MTCPKCGSQPPDHSLFCNKCGHSFAAQPIESTNNSNVRKSTPADEPKFLDYAGYSDEPKPPYVPPKGIQLSPTKLQIVQLGSAVDIVLTKNLPMLIERTVFQGQTPELRSAEGTDEAEIASLRRAYFDRPDFISTFATCCAATLLGKTRELSAKKFIFTGRFRWLLEEQIGELRTKFPQLPTVLSLGAFAVCYGRYLEHDGKVGFLFTPYLGYVRALNRGLVSEASRYRTEIETKFNGHNWILSMLVGLDALHFFVPLSDNPDVFKIPQVVFNWFTDNVPLSIPSP
jgi:hypothetical protein